MHCVSASSARIPNERECDFHFTTNDGQKENYTFQIAEVDKARASFTTKENVVSAMVHGGDFVAVEPEKQLRSRDNTDFRGQAQAQRREASLRERMLVRAADPEQGGPSNAIRDRA